MFVSQLQRLCLAVLMAIAGTAVSSAIHAEEPAPVIRTFLYIAGSNPENVPNFLADDSILVLVEKNDSAAGSLRFIDSSEVPCHPGQPDFLEGSLWSSAEARHLTTGPEQDLGPFFWLVTEETPNPPPKNAFTLTGPDGLVLYQEVFAINKCLNGSCCNNTDLDGLFYVAGEGAPSTSGDYVVVVTALFSN
ncbi:MAG TPA: hypothetical protein VMP01_03495 [Pirellulaceae bacterium]|nr:hypothetical protein [Pirellulaceae bacterium]